MFEKNHKIKSKQNKIISLCKRCNKGGISELNKSGLCKECHRSIYYMYRNKS